MSIWSLGLALPNLLTLVLSNFPKKILILSANIALLVYILPACGYI